MTAPHPPQSVHKGAVSELLVEIATFMRLAGENDFRAMAFDRAARVIESLPDDLNTYIAEKRLTELKGIGSSIAQDIYTYADTGVVPVLEKLRSEVPSGLVSWLGISGLGPKKIYKIYKELGITEISELRHRCLDGSVASLSGLGEKSAQKILKSIEWMDQFSERCRLDEADEIARRFYEKLKGVDGVEQLSVAGSLRRSMETIGDIDLLVAAQTDQAESIMSAFVNDEQVTEVLGQGSTKSSVRTTEGRQVDLRIVEPDQYAAALLYFTGSKEHNVALRQRARARKLQLNEYGLFHQNEQGQADSSRPLQAHSESDLYAHLGLGFIPPELREDQWEFEMAGDGAQPDLVQEQDIRGILHAHSDWSDGKYSIREMASACIDRGYTYLALTDHSRSAAYAGGLTIERVHAQWREIDAINKEFADQGVDFRVLKGIESDILADGSPDYPDDVLQGFDLVIASVHSSLDMEPERMLERLKRAAAHTHVHMIGHPTGRLLLRRDGTKADLEALIRFAAEHGTAIEINANPWRLDLDWRYGRLVRDTGLMSAICPDAHSTRGLDDVRYGVGIARKAGLPARHILNTLPVDELLSWLGKR